MEVNSLVASNNNENADGKHGKFDESRSENFPDISFCHRRSDELRPLSSSTK